MKFGMNKTTELTLELAIKEAPTKEYEVLPKVSQEDGMKFGVSEAVELSLELIIKEALTKVSQEGGTKFGMSEAAELSLELVIKKAPMKVSLEGEMKFGISEAAELTLELAIKEAPTKGREEILLPKGSMTMPPTMLLELKFSRKLRIDYQDQKDYDLPQTNTIEASTASTMATTVMILRNAFSSEIKLRSSSERDGWVNSFDASLKQEKIDQGHCHSQKRQGDRLPPGITDAISGA